MSATEDINPRSKDIDSLETGDLLAAMLDEEAATVEVVRGQLPAIERAVEDAVRAVRSGGAVCYAGAGTSGRLGVMDAAEVRPTFGRGCFRAVIAGGEAAISSAVEGAEDDGGAGYREALALSSRDMAVGISASGTTPFVLGFLRGARERGARCWLVTSNRVGAGTPVDGAVELLTGPEIIAGSTRLKAATATKLTLNLLSTAAMVRLGGVYDGLMVDVVPSNRKLVERAESIITEITGCGREDAAEFLRLSGMRPKVAALMRAGGLDREAAERLLEQCGGSLRLALERARR